MCTQTLQPVPQHPGCHCPARWLGTGSKASRYPLPAPTAAALHWAALLASTGWRADAQTKDFPEGAETLRACPTHRYIQKILPTTPHQGQQKALFKSSLTKMWNNGPSILATNASGRGQVPRGRTLLPSLLSVKPSWPGSRMRVLTRHCGHCLSTCASASHKGDALGSSGVQEVHTELSGTGKLKGWQLQKCRTWGFGSSIRDAIGWLRTIFGGPSKHQNSAVLHPTKATPYSPPQAAVPLAARLLLTAATPHTPPRSPKPCSGARSAPCSPINLTEGQRGRNSGADCKCKANRWAFLCNFLAVPLDTLSCNVRPPEVQPW